MLFRFMQPVLQVSAKFRLLKYAQWQREALESDLKEAGTLSSSAQSNKAKSIINLAEGIASCKKFLLNETYEALFP